jgi:hypothetical protein
MKCSFACCQSCRSRESFFVSWRKLISRDHWSKWVCWTSCTRWTSISFECCAESMRCRKLKKWFKRARRSLSITFREIRRCITCEIFRRSRRHRRDCRWHCFCRFFFFVCCLDRLDLIDSFDFNDLVSN